MTNAENTQCEHASIFRRMSEWFSLDGIVKRHVMRAKCGNDLPDEYRI